MTEKNIFENRAAAVGNDHFHGTDCDNCNETLIFAMKDNHHEFSLGLQTVLNCLKIAEKEGYVPPLPEEWWWNLH